MNNIHRRNTGSIEIITGSMYSGKSEELIRRVNRAVYAKKSVALFKHSIDKRYHESNVISHSKYEAAAIAVSTVEEMKNITDKLNPDIVGIDETQFFGKEIIEFVKKLAESGKRVICAGLDTNFRGEPFEPMPYLMAIAEKVDKLHAICTVCGSEASRTQRVVNNEPADYNEPIILVGAEERYEARCRVCHEVKMKDKKGKLYFIVGTDTNAGKSFITKNIIKKQLHMNKKISALKPIETGLDDFPEYKGSDSYGYAELLKKEISDVNIYFFKKPLSPLLASKIDGIDIDLKKIDMVIENKLQEYEELYVEGAGGLLVPICENITYLDYIIKWRNNAEVIIIGKNVLGGINHTLLTYEVLRENGVKIKEIIMNNIEKSDNNELINGNIDAVKKWCSCDVKKDSDYFL